jgi:hypothetical protein
VVRLFPVISQEPSTAEIVRLRKTANPAALGGLIKTYRLAVPFCPQAADSDLSSDCGLDERTRYQELYFTSQTASGRPLFKFYIAVERERLNRLVRVSVELCQNVDQSNGARYLKRAAEEALDGVIGVQSSMADLMPQRLFIPAFHFNPLLLKPFTEMEEELRQKRGTPAIEPIKQRFASRRACCSGCSRRRDSRAPRKIALAQQTQIGFGEPGRRLGGGTPWVS